MGSRGPVPKRSEERRRRNKEGTVETAAAVVDRITQPEPDEDWHPVAHDWYVSLASSGQAQFYEPSDWAFAAYIAHEMSRALNASRVSAQMFAAVSAAMTELLTTEGSRRRVRLELERNPSGADQRAAAKVARMDAYRRAAGS